jgi:hypothetical protein
MANFVLIVFLILGALPFCSDKIKDVTAVKGKVVSVSIVEGGMMASSFSVNVKFPWHGKDQQSYIITTYAPTIDSSIDIYVMNSNPQFISAEKPEEDDRKFISYFFWGLAILIVLLQAFLPKKTRN